MQSIRRWAVLVSVVAVSPYGWAQVFEDEAREAAPEPIGIELKLTDRMIYNWLDVVADDMANDYELTDDQYYQVNEMLHEHIPNFLRENREDISQVFTEFAEVFGSNRAPDSVTVAEWADRARPLLGRFRDTVEVMSDDFREVFDEGQMIKLDGYLAMMDAGTEMVEHRLTGWSEGEFNAESDWWGGSQFHEDEKGRRAEMERRTVEARERAIAFHLGDEYQPPGSEQAGGRREIPPPPGKRGPADQAGAASGKAGDATSDKWKIYTEQFIVRMQLNQSQTQQARLIYDRAAADRDRYQRRRLPELDRIARLAEAAKSEADRERVKQAKAAHDQGIEQMFERLKARLDRIPTRKQRALATAEQEAKRPE